MYQLPVSISSIRDLYDGKQESHLYILCYCVQAGVLRGLHNVEISSAIQLSSAERSNLLWIHGPSVIFLAFMGADMFARVKDELEGNKLSQSVKKRA